MSRHLIFTVLATIALAVSCSSTSFQEVPLPDQSVALENGSMSRIYIVRKQQIYGSRRGVRVFDTGREIGTVTEGFLCWERNPGRATIRVVFDRRPIDGGPVEGFFEQQCEVGEVYYCGIGVERTGKPTFELMSAADGMKLVGAGKSAKPN